MFEADSEWEWTAVHPAFFDRLKQAMINATHLSAIDPRQPYHLYTEASKDCGGYHASAGICAWEVQGTSSIYGLYVVDKGNLLKVHTRFGNRSCWPSC